MVLYIFPRRIYSILERMRNTRCTPVKPKRAPSAATLTNSWVSGRPWAGLSIVTSRGGKRLREELFGLFESGGLIAFEKEDEIGSWVPG